MTTKTKPIQEAILKQRGLRIEKPIIDRPKKLSHSVPMPSFDNLKTADMKLIELKYGIRIEKLLLSGSLNYICSLVKNDVDRSTISRWKKKLKLNYTEDNLPSCKHCPHRQEICNLNVCALLVKLEMPHLLEAKKNQIVKETDGILHSTRTVSMESTSKEATDS